MIYIIGIVSIITTVYFCSVAWIIIGIIKIKKRPKHRIGSVEVEKVSVIIPVRNEDNNIIKCLESLKKQNFNIIDFEIIIINDHSTDCTCEIINDFIAGNELDIKLFSLIDNSSKKEALKYGIEKSKYSIISTTDADCILPKNWLLNISLSFTNGTEMLLGPIVFKQHKGFLYWFQALDMLAVQGIEFGVLGYQKSILNNAANLSYYKKSYVDVGGFDNFNTPSGDDVFLLEKFKLHAKKIKGLFTQDFTVVTNPETTFLGFLNQRLRWSSKTRYYSDKLLVFFSSIVLIQNISLIFIYLGIPLVEKYTGILIFLLVCKWLIDFILLFLVAYFFDRRKALIYFIPAQIIYPIYIILIWIISMTMKFEWKGRRFNG